MHHYTYWLTCQDTNEHYIGVRSSKVLPELDHYWSSSKVVKAMMRDGKKFTKQVLAEWDTREEALSHEILLHDIFDVVRNDSFLNRSKQKSTGFCTFGFMHTEEWKSRKSEGMKGKYSGAGNPMYGKEMPVSARQKIAEYRSGKKFTEESRRRLSKSKTGMKRNTVTCPHCGKVGGDNNMSRWHFNNCKAILVIKRANDIRHTDYNFN